jgi:uncharacterized membrane protein YeaQ/YmgE (transglycosylase-associated protein family)
MLLITLLVFVVFCALVATFVIRTAPGHRSAGRLGGNWDLGKSLLEDQAVPGSIPYGWLGRIVAGLLGSFLGELILGGLGPEVAGISLVPAFLGAVILAFAGDFFLKARGSESERRRKAPRTVGAGVKPKGTSR